MSGDNEEAGLAAAAGASVGGAAGLAAAGASATDPINDEAGGGCLSDGEEEDE